MPGSGTCEPSSTSCTSRSTNARRWVDRDDARHACVLGARDRRGGLGYPRGQRSPGGPRRRRISGRPWIADSRPVKSRSRNIAGVRPSLGAKSRRRLTPTPSMAELLVTIGGAALIVAPRLVLLRPPSRKPGAASRRAPEVKITVKGGYSPNTLVREGTPVRLVFDRQEAGDCTSRVVFPDLGLSRRWRRSRGRRSSSPLNGAASTGSPAG